MTKQQALGQLRALLTAFGAALTTWGVTDGNAWAPVIGVLMAGYSLTWGLLHHKVEKFKLRWSLARKFINAVGAAMVTYGVMRPEQAESVGHFVGLLGPFAAMFFSFIANDTNDTGSRLPIVLLPFLVPLCVVLVLPSCTNWQPPIFTEDGCILQPVDTDVYGDYYIGFCEDGRYVVMWTGHYIAEPDAPVTVRYTRWPGGDNVIHYMTETGWVQWSSKSGVSLGPVPEAVSDPTP